MLKRSLGEKIFNVFNVLGMFMLTALFVVPVLFVIKMSLETSLIGDMTLSLFPRQPELIFYRQVVRDPAVYGPFLNSIFVTIVGTALGMLINSVGAYALSKRELPGNKFFIYFLIIIPMLFSGGLVPTYLLIRALGMIDKMAVLIIPAVASGWYMILIRNYYWSIPNSLVESAKIDGAEEFTVFYKIILPLSKPVLAAIALFTGVGFWNTFMSAIIYLRTPTKYTFPVKLREVILLQGYTGAELEQLMIQMGIDPQKAYISANGLSGAMMIVSMLPIVIVYPYLQKYFTQGLMIGSIKG
ncbi:MAG: carbohydrate ABC transporter permease [Clostridia bacterium]